MDVQRFESLPGQRRFQAASLLLRTRLGKSPYLLADERRAIDEALSSARSVRPNVDLVREGERADSIFILVDGWACRYATTPDGSRQLPAILIPGDVANLDTLMFERLNYGVRTLTEASVVALPRDRALALVAEHPGIAKTFTWLALVENAILSAWSLSLGRRSALERLAHFLCEMGVRLDAGERDGSSFAFPLTQEQIADALGLTSVHVNRTMQHLRSEGMAVTANRTVTLPDVEGLRRLGSFDPSYLHIDPPAPAQPA